ncbi:MAG: hypothetical protein A3F31_00405 [Candidatus Levybacteria bacterium RIFCSPHIGHO2_12_FULL_38_12]|nr:MAG: hypothetical protein A2770_03475 [Candidatus Levybacteria bacterium RIFCSPHIGHO2_01_FULL_38_12]OGH23220.1 MAG: hypothetical protein A3F31_00405 [Candidatus Levybacteria bacterium RIFCSPHIGHO2_12_FULL_38_12]OGH34498.1 MAG: hypothetical protein A3A47_00925 [Candidatus Levybacteria bacterium RIFCSPLOWO2_01_FULL_37_20]OGH44746.1 MAG: hypothetical protein A3J14_00285 [Candidatus Levybacteria bacterium RIFCSPLOWO2_02_FULL_37_18]
MKLPSDLYPSFSVVYIQNPNRIYAIPILGFLIKFFICIPQYIMLFFLGIALLIVVFIINPFVVLFSGKYWNTAYSLVVGVQVMSMKISLYFFGLTNTYPGFDLSTNGDFTLDIPKPETPNRLFAVPLFGGFARLILLIPFYFYMTIIEYVTFIGVAGSSFVVLFSGKYPESMYELIRDWHRLNLASSLYFVGIYDSYPSFWISMNHKNIKIALIALVALYTIFYQIFTLGAMF